MNDKGRCPTHETLAELAENRLAKTERTTVFEHMDHCNSCFKLYAETLRALEEEAQAHRSNRIPMKGHHLPWQMSAGKTVVLGLAIAASLVVVFGLKLLDRGPSPKETYHMAMASLGQRDGWRLKRFRFPTEIESTTLTGLHTTRGEASWDTLEDPVFQPFLASLIEWVNRHPGDVKTRMDLVALQLAIGQLDAALINASLLEKQLPNDPAAIGLRIVCEYLIAGRRGDNDQRRVVRKEMETQVAHFPANAPLLYNLARMMAEMDGNQAARTTWQRYLTVAEESPRTQWVRNNLK